MPDMFLFRPVFLNVRTFFATDHPANPETNLIHCELERKHIRYIPRSTRYRKTDGVVL